MLNIKKGDALAAFAIGAVAALLIFLIGKNTAAENEAVAGVLKYAYVLFFLPFVCVAGLIIAYFISGLSEKLFVLQQFSRFFLTGGLNFLIDLGVLSALIFVTGISTGLGQSFFKAVSFLVAATNSYFWNKFWVFEKKESGNAGEEFWRFFAVTIVGFFVNLVVDYVLVNMTGAYFGVTPKILAQTAAVISALAALMWNFLGYKFIVFKNG